MMKKFLLIDGTNLFYRGYHTTKGVDKEGRHVGGIAGTMRMLPMLLKKFNPHTCIIAWDHGKCHKRVSIYPEYKAHRRQNMTEEEKANIVWQQKMCYSILKKVPVRQIKLEGIEADDVIGYLSEHLKGQKIIVSNDHDMLQLIDDQTSVFLPKDVKMITEDNLEDFLGFPPRWFVHYKALVGDTSDNVKGIRGVGPKTAQKLMLEHAEKDKLKIPKEWHEVVKRNKQLMKIGAILDDGDIQAIREQYKNEKEKELNGMQVRAMFANLNFRQLSGNFQFWIGAFNRLRGDLYE